MVNQAKSNNKRNRGKGKNKNNANKNTSNGIGTPISNGDNNNNSNGASKPLSSLQQQLAIINTNKEQQQQETMEEQQQEIMEEQQQEMMEEQQQKEEKQTEQPPPPPQVDVLQQEEEQQQSDEQAQQHTVDNTIDTTTVDNVDAAVAESNFDDNNDKDDGIIPLHDKWTLWFDNPRLAPPNTEWKDNLHSCGTFNDVAMLWSIFNNLRTPSTLSNNSNYSVFRYGVLPAWEDDANVNGGKFVLTLQKNNNSNANKNSNSNNNTNSSSSGSKIDEFWLRTVLAVVGETMDATGDEVMGAVVSIRKAQDRIALWLKTADRDVCVSIGERWKKVLDLQKMNIRYQTHKDAAASGSSFRNEVQFEV